MNNFRLQAFPAAFLGLLGLKTEGRAPSEFGDVVSGGIDLADHYLAQLQEIGVADGNVQNAGDALTITVPAGKFYRVHAVSFTLTLATETNVQGRITYQPSQSPQRVALGRLSHVAGAAALDVTVSVVLDRPLLALPGSIISFRLDSALAAARAGALRTLHEPIDA